MKLLESTFMPNNIFHVIVFRKLFENLQLLPQPKLRDMDTENFQ